MNQDIRVGTTINRPLNREELNKLESTIKRIGARYETILLTSVYCKMDEKLDDELKIRVVYQGGCSTAGFIVQEAMDEFLDEDEFFSIDDNPIEDIVPFDVSGVKTELLEEIGQDIALQLDRRKNNTEHIMPSDEDIDAGQFKFGRDWTRIKYDTDTFTPDILEKTLDVLNEITGVTPIMIKEHRDEDTGIDGISIYFIHYYESETPMEWIKDKLDEKVKPLLSYDLTFDRYKTDKNDTSIWLY